MSTKLTGRYAWFGVLFVCLALVVSACGSSGSGGEATGGEGAESDQPLSGASFSVGSKDFTEQLVLGQMTIAMLEQAGASVEDNTNIAGTANTRAALLSGDIDMYWEYTGTGWITHLGETAPIPDSQEQYQAVADRDLEENSIKWLEPAPFNNTYALAYPEEKAGELGATTLSELAQLSKDSPDLVTVCIESEFSTRDDGLPGLEKAYEMTVPESNINLMDLGVVYNEVDKGESCNYGEVFTTDGRIAALGLNLLEDDKSFFPIYNPSVTLRQETFDEYPQLADVLGPLAAALSTETMQELNSKVDVDGEEPETVAREWLQEQGLLNS